MIVKTSLYEFDIDTNGITAICTATGERSNITDCNGIADTLGFEIDEDGEVTEDLDPDAIAAQLEDPATVAELAKRLAEDRDEGGWHDN